MPIFVSAARKALSTASRYLPIATSKAESRLFADHGGIQGALPFRDGGNIWLIVAIAPSQSAKRVEATVFTERATGLAELIFAGLPYVLDFTNAEMIRYVVPEAPESQIHNDSHALTISNTGLVTVRWGLELTPVPDSTDVTWSLDEAVAVLHRLYKIAHDPRYAALHQRRWFEKSRRLDWRIGVSNSVTDAAGTRRWRDFTANGRMPSVRSSRQQPFLPAAGYTPEALTGVKPSVGPVDLFRPPLQELLTNAGFAIGVRECVQDALTVPTAHQLAPAMATPELDAAPTADRPQP